MNQSYGTGVRFGWINTLDNNIHVTKDGGNTWNVDFTTQNPIQDIKFSNNCVYAITKGEIVRKFL